MPSVPGMLPVVTTSHGLTERGAASLAAILGTDAPLVRAFDEGGPMSGADPDGATWHLATCHRCGSDFAQPFFSPERRDAWAVAHVASSEHSVILSEDPPGARPAMILRRVSGMWMWICTSCTGLRGDRGWGGHSAIAEFRGHVCGESR